MKKRLRKKLLKKFYFYIKAFYKNGISDKKLRILNKNKKPMFLYRLPGIGIGNTLAIQRATRI